MSALREQTFVITTAITQLEVTTVAAMPATDFAMMTQRVTVSHDTY